MIKRYSIFSPFVVFVVFIVLACRYFGEVPVAQSQPRASSPESFPASTECECGVTYNNGCNYATCGVGESYNISTCSCQCNLGSACNQCPTGEVSASGICCPSATPYNVGGTCRDCQLYAIKFIHGSGYKVTNFTVGKMVGGETQFGCFPTLINKILSDGGLAAGYSATSPVSFTGEHYGAFKMTVPLWDKLLANSGKDRTLNYQDNKKLIKCTAGYGATNSMGHNAGTQIGGGRWGKTSPDPGCKGGVLYLDENCKLQEVSSVDSNVKLCGSVNYYAQIGTPISLVWDSSYKNIPSTMVSFKLNPQSNKSTWLWRGSSALPLLVYDPEHKGVINSASQLFGNWTFNTNSLASLAEKIPLQTPWKNGYEALATMDKNLDLKVSGAELKDLALWFDANQDGLSQDGEVKLLSDVGVSSLSYQPDSREDGSLAVTNGYERVVDGKVVSGRSIDWVEKGFEEGFTDLLENLYSKSLEQTPITMSKEENISTSPASALVTKGLYGVWAYELDQPSSGNGYLVFDPSEKGFTGTTIKQVGMNGVEKVKSQILFSSFSGESQISKDGLTEIKFIVEGDSASELKSTAKLSADGSELIGKTVVSGSKVSSAGSYEYSWKAKKLK